MTAVAKAAVRARVGAWRRGLRPEEIAEWSGALAAHLLSWEPLTQARHVLGYIALAREPQTTELLAALAARGHVVWLPMVSGERLEVGAPGAGSRADPAALDAVLVPGLAFDHGGHRLGRGGGHYDRFLASVRPDCLRIGMCFAGQVLDAVPLDPWDQPVDVIMTERGLVEGAPGREPERGR